MALEDTLLRYERVLAGGRGAEYRRLLDDAAIVIVPGQTLDKATTVEAMDSSPGWDEYSIDDVRLIELGADAAALHYRFDGRRGTDF